MDLRLRETLVERIRNRNVVWTCNWVLRFITLLSYWFFGLAWLSCSALLNPSIWNDLPRSHLSCALCQLPTWRSYNCSPLSPFSPVVAGSASDHVLEG